MTLISLTDIQKIPKDDLPKLLIRPTNDDTRPMTTTIYNPHPMSQKTIIPTEKDMLFDYFGVRCFLSGSAFQPRKF
jgi:hypothetical protein